MKQTNLLGSKAKGATLAALLLGALMSQSATAQGVLDDEDLTADSYFDTPNWAEDDYGWYDEDFDWDTSDPWYDNWNDTDLSAWNDDYERGHWGLFGYDDADELGAFDW